MKDATSADTREVVVGADGIISILIIQSRDADRNRDSQP